MSLPVPSFDEINKGIYYETYNVTTADSVRWHKYLHLLLRMIKHSTFNKYIFCFLFFRNHFGSNLFGIVCILFRVRARAFILKLLRFSESLADAKIHQHRQHFYRFADDAKKKQRKSTQMLTHEMRTSTYLRITVIWYRYSV